MGQKLVHHAENLAALGEDQYGSHLNKSCLDIVARKMLTLNISRLTWHDLITFDNDAISCFDQQIPLFAMMVCQKFGLSSKICKIFAETLSDMRYYIQSGAKGSKKFHHHLKNDLMYGTGHGNGASPPIWLFTSVFLMPTLRNYIKAWNLKSLMGWDLVHTQ